jgi:hypothetical protein
MSYRREVRGADESITNAIDSPAQPEQRKHDDALTARPRPCGLIARKINKSLLAIKLQGLDSASELGRSFWSG